MNRNCLVIGDLNVDLIVSGINRPLEKGSEAIAQKHFLDIGGSERTAAKIPPEPPISKKCF